MAKLSASGEWLVADNDVPSSGPVELKMNTKLRSASFFDANICCECGHTFRACDCKACLKCGTTFMKFFGTTLIKGRSHCRLCASPVCVTCVVMIEGLEKICTRCQLKQKEEEISTEKALSAICEAKFGLNDSYGNLTKLKTSQQKTNALFDAVKKGLDHVMLTLFNFGCKVDSTDSKENTPLFYAAEGGYLQCIVLLLEKGADIKARNNVGWSPLHAVSWKGTTDHHTECVKYLIEMGAGVFIESLTGETAGDVAERCGANQEIIQILRAAEVEFAMEEMDRKITIILSNAPNPKEKHFCRLIMSLLNFIKKSNEEFEREKKDKVVDDDAKENNNQMKRTQTLLDISKDYKCNSNEETTHTFCHKCRGPTILNDSTPPPLASSQSSENVQKPTADVEPMLRSQSPKPIIPIGAITEKSLQMNDLLAAQKKLEKEKVQWEERCRKLMTSIAVSNKEHKNEIEKLEERIKTIQEERKTEMVKFEATYTNKMSKVRLEADMQIQEMEERVQEIESAQSELLQLHRQYKLTWVPDQLVNECQNCRAHFSKTIRKHHCRCCGRIFCNPCSQEKIRLDTLGYTKPVRVCTVCFALVDNVLRNVNSSKKIDPND